MIFAVLMYPELFSDFFTVANSIADEINLRTLPEFFLLCIVSSKVNKIVLTNFAVLTMPEFESSFKLLSRITLKNFEYSYLFFTVSSNSSLNTIFLEIIILFKSFAVSRFIFLEISFLGNNKGSSFIIVFI